MNTHQIGELEHISTFFWFRTCERSCESSFEVFTISQIFIFFFIYLIYYIWQDITFIITYCLSSLNNIHAAVAFWVSVKGLGILKTFWPWDGWKQRYLLSTSRQYKFDTSCQKKRVSSRFLNEVARVSAFTIVDFLWWKLLLKNQTTGLYY